MNGFQEKCKKTSVFWNFGPNLAKVGQKEPFSNFQWKSENVTFIPNFFYFSKQKWEILHLALFRIYKRVHLSYVWCRSFRRVHTSPTKRYVARIIRSDNEAVTKRLTFNSDESHRPGRISSLLKAVLHHETQAAARFFQDAINRKI